MKKPVLVVTRRYPMPAVVERIEREFEARLPPEGRTFTQDELLQAADGADAIFVAPSDKVGAEFFAKLPKSVKVMATFSVGFDHVDVAAASAAKIPVANTPGVLSDATADTALLLLLGASRRAYEAQQLVRSGQWASFKGNMLSWQITGKRLGILGMGRIGQEVAKRAKAFGMEIHYNNRRELSADEAQGAVFHADVRELLRVSDCLSLHAPSTPETRHFLNAETIELLPQGAIVVNTARGALVDDAALIAALKSGRVAAAGLDVYEGEPHVNPGYLSLPNAYLLPHIGSETIETRTAMGMLALDNIAAVLRGEPALTLIPGIVF